MSFRDLGSGHAAKSQQQPKQRPRDDDSPYERDIRASIQEMQDSLRQAAEHLERARRSAFSRRMGESLDKSLERGRDLAQETERLFREWTVHLAGEPAKRHRKKFSYDKLQRAFGEEVEKLKELAGRAMTAQQEQLAHAGEGYGHSVECRPICGEQEAGVDEERGLLDDSGDDAAWIMAQEEASAGLQSRVAHEREEGIRRIQSQVSEVNQIFRDLASIVHEQGRQFESIEQQAESAATHAKMAGHELKKASDRQRSARERLFCMLACAVVLLCLIVLPHMHAVHAFHHPDLALTEVGHVSGAGFDASADRGALRGVKDLR